MRITLIPDEAFCYHGGEGAQPRPPPSAMTKEQLDSAILSALFAFESSRKPSDRPHCLWEFAPFFGKHAGFKLSKAVHKLFPGAPWTDYVAGVPGVEVFRKGAADRIRLRPGTPIPVDGMAPKDRALAEECRLALLSGDGETLPEELAAKCREAKWGEGGLLSAAREWASAARKIRARAQKLVASGETRQDASFDTLARDAANLVRGRLTGNPAKDAMGWMLGPFYRGEEEVRRIVRLRNRTPAPGKTGGSADEKKVAARLEKQVARALSKPGASHPNSLPSLSPSPSWTVLIDETGFDFTPGSRESGRGRMVAVFVPEDTLLPDLPENWHAVELRAKGRLGDVFDVAGRLLTSQCGVLGVSVKDMPATTAHDQRLSCLEYLLSLGFRLLPVDGPTQLRLRVEQWGAFAERYGKNVLEVLAEGILKRLSSAFPERARLISTSGKVVDKRANAWNGYADAAAFAWGSPNMTPFLSLSRWAGTCFLEGKSADALRRAMDAFRWDGLPAPADWTTLLATSGHDEANSIASAFLRAIGQEAQADPDVWRLFLDETRRHLDSKAIRMDVLGRQLRWLEEWKPDDARLPSRARLMWLVAELAAANHAGRVDLHGAKAFREEFDELSLRLFREDCPLCAHAHLHLAVSFTNAFEFEKARLLLLPMRKWSVAEPGLRMWGRLQSTLGQLEAFHGATEAALRFFDEAVRLFRDLSEDSELDVSQTLAYAATAAMDARTPDADARLAAYLWDGPYSD